MEDKGVCFDKEEEFSFEKQFGFNGPRPVGPKIQLEIFVKKLSTTVETTGMTHEMQKFESRVGRVCKIGSACFKGERFKDWSKDELPKVGDWVVFKPGAGNMYKYGPPGKGVLVMNLFDDYIDDIVDDPNYVDRV
jgi:hypothetical protein